MFETINFILGTLGPMLPSNHNVDNNIGIWRFWGDEHNTQILEVKYIYL